jgi:probable HAF family extracellular repeat protein
VSNLIPHARAVSHDILLIRKNREILERIHERLATGRKISRPIDNPSGYFAASELRDHNIALQERLDGIQLTSRIVDGAGHGLKAIRNLVSSMKSLGEDALTSTQTSRRQDLQNQFMEMRSQIESVAKDSIYNGINLLTGNLHELIANGESTGTLGGATARAEGVSFEGSFIVGSSQDSSGDDHAYRWDATGGIIDLQGGLTGESYANGVAQDGMMVVGLYTDGSSDAAFVWEQSKSQMELLNALSGDNSSKANAVSSAGNVIVGKSYDYGTPGNSVAVLWHDGSTAVSMGVLSGQSNSEAFAVSSDGSVSVGSSGTKAFRYYNGQMTELSGLSGSTNSGARAISGDGRVSVGFSEGEAVRWIATGQAISLGTIAGGSDFTATGVSNDGSIITGTYSDGSTQRVFIWDEAQGMRDLQNTLTDDFGYTFPSGETLIDTGNLSWDGKQMALTTLGGGVYHSYTVRVSDELYGQSYSTQLGNEFSGSQIDIQNAEIFRSEHWNEAFEGSWGNTRTYQDDIVAAIGSLEKWDAYVAIKAKKMVSSFNLINIRQVYIKDRMNINDAGIDQLTLVDLNEEGARMLSMEQRMSLSNSSLTLTIQTKQNTLRGIGMYQ